VHQVGHCLRKYQIC